MFIHDFVDVLVVSIISASEFTLVLRLSCFSRFDGSISVFVGATFPFMLTEACCKALKVMSELSMAFRVPTEICKLKRIIK